MAFELNAWTVLLGVAWGCVLLWLVAAAVSLCALRRQQPLEALAGERLKGTDAPLVSILVPARNEEHRVLERAVRSMLAQDYGSLEIIAVNDRSTDATGPILRSIALDDARLRVVEGAEPPAGWLGKPHALQQALKASRGEWVLATDADMIFAPRALRTVVALALERRYDAVTLLPHIICLSFWERVFMPAFGWFMLMVLPLERANNPRRPEALGVGGFFLIRRAALERVGGYRAVQSEVVEDLRMAEILKETGASIRAEYAPALAATRMQTNLPEIWEGFTKNLFGGAKFSALQTFAGILAVLLFSIAPPFVALACALLLLATGRADFWSQLLVPTFLVWLLQVCIFAFVNRAWSIPARYALTVPLGHALFIAILTNSALRILYGSGVTWKGRKLYERAGVRPPRGRGWTPTPDLPSDDE
ncbi:MAG TPA: glycosyltransferase [Pyrinomonadaceae bacterium]|jgi:cellulose synthase/poly-beta-1,6-N-acetylglucosamine synthase-like glycosyltransferase|nr:glycosyltransferase [Pyrinomonadaceae bacterium]